MNDNNRVCQIAARSTSTTVLIALGANLGDARGNVLAAAAQLAAERPLLLSSLWRSTPVDCPPGAQDFVNAVALCPLPDLPAELFLEYLLQLERRFGRYRSTANAPRTLDLDLILFGTQRCSSPHLTLPHPRALQRAFVLRPAAELAPDLIWPGTRLTVRQHLLRLPADTGMTRLV